MELEEEEQVEMAVAEAAATEAAKNPGFFIVGDGNSSSSKCKETPVGKKKFLAGKWKRK
jgi:hypothetical protein